MSGKSYLLFFVLGAALFLGGSLSAEPALQPWLAQGTGAQSGAGDDWDWQDQLVDAFGILGNQSASALDAQGNPHIVYTYDTTGSEDAQAELKYAFWDGVTWHFSTVDPSVDDRLQPAIVVGEGDDGRPVVHLLYGRLINPEAFDLIYAKGGPVAWSAERVPIRSLEPLPPEWVVKSIDLALDASQIPHITFTEVRSDLFLAPNEVAYGRRSTDGNWHIERVDESELPTHVKIGLASALALDALGRPYLAYALSDPDSPGSYEEPLKYAYWNGSAWQIQTLDDRAEDPDLALDAAGRPHIAYDRMDRVKYARWDGATWEVETIMDDPVQMLGVSLALDNADRAHIAWVRDPSLNGIRGVQYSHWDGAAWLTERIADGSGASLALDEAGNAHISYQEREYNDLHTIQWAPATRQIEVAPFAATEPALAVDLQGRPFLSFYGAGGLNLVRWDTPPESYFREWAFTPIPGRGDYNDLRLTYDFERRAIPNISYLNPETRQLEFSEWNSTTVWWDTEVVDDKGVVGWYTSLAIDIFGRPTIGYWDFTNFRIKYAERIGDFWHIHSNNASPPLDAYSAFYSLSLGHTPAGSDACCRSYIAYYALPPGGSEGDLRLATWDGTAWSDELVDSGDGADVGLYASLAIDYRSGQPVIAYYDATNGALKYAWREAGAWTIQTVEAGLGTINNLSLELAAVSLLYPRIAYTTDPPNTIRLAWKTPDTATWQIDPLITDASVPYQEIAFDVRERDRIVYNGTFSGHPIYLFRTATLPLPLYYNPLQPCTEPEDFEIPPDPTARQAASGTTGSPEEPVDLGILRGLRDLFATDSDGQRYIDLYYEHAPETGLIGLSNPSLLWDAYRALQNFLPGFEALVAGEGDQVIITQEMVDQANDIADWLVAAGSPALDEVINKERATTNDLQDFVGLSFDEASILLGVPPPPDLTEKFYVPLIVR